MKLLPTKYEDRVIKIYLFGRIYYCLMCRKRSVLFAETIKSQMLGNCKKLRTFQINSIILDGCGIEIILAGLSHITIAGQIRLS